MTSIIPSGAGTVRRKYIVRVITALTANPAAWAKTALFVTYDENGRLLSTTLRPARACGHFGEYVTVAAVPDPTVVGNPPVSGPIGLGFRVPTLVILAVQPRRARIVRPVRSHLDASVSRDAIRGRGASNLSAWRRQTVGDMTSAFNLNKPDTSIPPLPPTVAALSTAITQCVANLVGFAPYPLPAIDR